MTEHKLVQSKINEIVAIHKGKWINTNLIYYTDPKGEKRQWEGISNANKHDDDSAPDSVQVVAILKRNLHHNCFVLVQQFRPAIGCFSIEFPAGYVDKTDKNIQATALRELFEETGFTGTIADGDHLEAATAVEPGNQSGTIATINVVIDGDDPKNIDCRQHLDEGEFIKILLVPVRELLNRLNKFIHDKNDKYLIDAKLYSFAIGLSIGSTLNSKDKPLSGVI